MSDRFEEAYRRARRKVGSVAWRQLSNEQQEATVATEMRALEEEQPGEDCGGSDHSNGGGGVP